MTLQIVRATVFLLFAWSVVVAVGSWALRTRRINPFGFVGQRLRRMTDMPLKPVEEWLLKRGGNPQNAGWWLIGIVMIGGILVITLSEWAIVQAARITSAGASGPRSLLRLMLYYAIQLVSVLLMVRVVGSWFGFDRHRRWMRPAYLFTDWIVSPLRRIIPPIGFIDLSPVAAWFLLQFLALPLIMGIV